MATRRRRIPGLDDCVFESQVAGGIALYDASHLMPRHAHRERVRPISGIDRYFVHHSGILGRAGVAGAYGSARYMVYRRRPKFPGPGYTFWTPAEPLHDTKDNLVTLRLNTDDVLSWHTGGTNTEGVAQALQGNLNSKPLTESHEESLEAMIPWATERYRLEMPHALSWHSDAGRFGGRPKKRCPGKYAEAWLKGYIRGYRTEAQAAGLAG